MMNTASIARSLVRCSRMATRPAVLRTFASASTWAHHDPPKSSNNKTKRAAHVDDKVPENDYYHGHLMADHLEYLEDVMDRSVQLESELGELQETYEKMPTAFHNVGFTTSSEIDELFLDAKTKKANMKKQIAELQAVIESAKRTIAVDGPDGLPDDIVAHEMDEINHIIDDAAVLEDKEAVLQQHAADEANRKVLGVDGPDGIPDDIVAHEMDEIKHIIDDAHDKDAILKMRAEDEANRKVLGVDAPDGLPDDLQSEDLHVVQDMIQGAALHEDKQKIVREHNLADAVRKERARDPEHDW